MKCQFACKSSENSIVSGHWMVDAGGFYDMYLMILWHWTILGFTLYRPNQFLLALFSYFRSCCLYRQSVCVLAMTSMKAVRGLELHRVFPQCLPSVTTVRRHKELFVPGTEASPFSPFYDYAQVDLCLSGGVFSTKTKFLTVFIFMIDYKNLSV